MGRKRQVLVCALALGPTLLGVGVASASAVGRDSTSGTPTVALRHTAKGEVLVDKHGRSLYDFTRDERNRSRCGLSCQGTWAPLISRTKPRAGSGVHSAHLQTLASGQVTYYGRPLYSYAGDTRAGQIHGEDSTEFGGRWYLVNAGGRSVK